MGWGVCVCVGGGGGGGDHLGPGEGGGGDKTLGECGNLVLLSSCGRCGLIDTSSHISGPVRRDRATYIPFWLVLHT